MIRLAIQSRLVPGASIREKHERAIGYGFDGIELSGTRPMIELAEEALRDSVPVTAMCSGHRGWFIDPDLDQVAACREDVKTLLELSARLGGAPLIIVPIYGRTHQLPNSSTGRTVEDDRALWLEGLRDVTDHAELVGGNLVVEAINRYENSISVNVQDAVKFAREMHSERVRAMGDVFHMNIEEVNLGEAFESMGDMLAYVHLADSQRWEPGQGHLPWDSVFDGLLKAGYGGYASLECNLSGPADEVLPAAVRFLRERLAKAEQRHRAREEAAVR